MLGKDIALRYIISFMLSVIVVYGFYVQLHGDFSPGGGFQAGMILASAVVMFSVVFGDVVTMKAVPYSLVRTMSALGLFVYMATGAVSVFLGGDFLSYFLCLFDSVTEQQIGIFLVELGVGIAVCGSMVSIYFDFASWRNRYTLA